MRTSNILIDYNNCLVAAAGIEFGFPLHSDTVQRVKYTGTATIMATA